MSSQQSRNKTKENDLKDWNQSLEYESLRDGEHESDKKESDQARSKHGHHLSCMCIQFQMLTVHQQTQDVDHL